MIKIHKKLLLGGLVALLVVGGSWFAFCHYVMKSVKKEFLQIESSLKQEGFEIFYDTLDFQQHLFCLEVNMVQPHFKTPKGFGLQGNKIEMILRPWDWRKMTFTLPHMQDLIVYAGKNQIKIGVKNAHGFIKLTKQHNLEEILIDVEEVHSLFPGKAKTVGLKDVFLDVQSLSAPLELDLTLQCEVKGVEELFQLPLAAQPIAFKLDARLAGFQGKALPHSLEAWRDGGGVLDVQTLNFTWPPFAIKGEGTLTLDKGMYPLGAFSTQITGYKDGLHYLVTGQVIQRNNATMVGFVLDMLSRSDNKGKQEIQVPLTLQDRSISIGGIPVWEWKH